MLRIAVVAAALTTSQCLTAEASTTEGGFTTGAWKPVNASNYAIDSPCEHQRWNITQDSASAVWLHFSSVDLASGAHLMVSSLNGSKALMISSPSTDVTTRPISGSGVVLQYVPSSEDCVETSKSTLTLNTVGYSYSEDAQVDNEEREICGSADTMKNAVCFSTGTEEDKTMVAKAKTVMRTQRTRDDNAIVTCTAWLWGNQGHIISNNHCFSSQEMVDAAKFEFDVQTTGCSDDCTFATCPIGKTLVGKDNVKFIKSDATLDYSLMQITNDAAYYVNTYGYLQVRSTAPAKEEIYIPQQPKGGAKKITKTDNDADSKAATVLNLDYSVEVEGITYTHLIAYAADTEEGSSGSPVISRSDNVVVGLHRIGDCDNAATPSDQLATALQAIVSGNDGVKTA